MARMAPVLSQCDSREGRDAGAWMTFDAFNQWPNHQQALGIAKDRVTPRAVDAILQPATNGVAGGMR